MPKTYGNRKLDKEIPIDESFELLNENSEDANNDLAELYSEINTTNYNLNQKDESTNQRINSHTTGQSEKHSTDDITNATPITGSDLTDVILNLKSQIEAIVAGGTEVDARLSQALVDLIGVTWPNFKNLQDYWQERNVIFDQRTSKYIVTKNQISEEGIPQIVYEEVN